MDERKVWLGDLEFDLTGWERFVLHHNSTAACQYHDV